MLGTLQPVALPSHGNFDHLPASQVSEISQPNYPDPDPLDGMIYPPENIRVLLNTLVKLVVDFGPDMEKRVKANHATDDRFNFLNASHPYHAYYQHQLSDRFMEVQFKNHIRSMFAQDVEASRNIVVPADTRPDIFFGRTKEEISNAIKAKLEKEIKKQPKQVIWDGSHSGSIGTTAPPPRSGLPLNMPPPIPNMQYSDLNKPFTDCNIRNPSITPLPPTWIQVLTSWRSEAFCPVPPPSMNMIPPPPLPQRMPPPLTDEPEPKRQRVDASRLIPVDHFLAQHPGPARIMVSVPNVDKGNLKGQQLGIMIQSLSETIGSLKEKIAGEVELPVNKQKLRRGRAGILKDDMSLAQYNIGAGETLTLVVERDASLTTCTFL